MSCVLSVSFLFFFLVSDLVGVTEIMPDQLIFGVNA